MTKSQITDKLLANKTGLVLTDAFPPHTDGGAEVSLSACLSELPAQKRKSLLVLVFSRHVRDTRVSTYLGMDVVHISEGLGWPFAHLGYGDFDATVSTFPTGEKMYSRYTRIKRHLRSGFKREVFDAYNEAAAKPEGGFVVDHLIGKNDLRVSLTMDVLRRAPKIDTLLCDNTRSILVGAAALKRQKTACRSVAVVRDNRFHCARPSQNRMVGGKICKSCNFGCAKEDVEDQSAVPLRQKTLSRTDKARTIALQRFDKVIVTSHELARHVAPLLAKGQEFARIANTYGFHQEVNQIVSAVPQSERSDLLIVGMLNENKGQMAFLEASVAWLHANPDIRLNFIGKGERLTKSMMALIKKHGLEDQVKLLGFVDRKSVYEHIRRSTLVLAPTVWPEPFGRIPLEAGISGRAVVAFAVGGLNESIIHDHTGVLIKPGDYTAFHRAIDWLLNHPDIRLKMEAAARAWIEKRYSPKHTSHAFVEEVFEISLEDAAT